MCREKQEIKVEKVEKHEAVLYPLLPTSITQENAYFSWKQPITIYLNSDDILQIGPLKS